MTPAASAPFLAATLLLGGAGLAKLFRPDDLGRALEIAGLPSDRRLVRLGAGAEVVVAMLALVVPRTLTGALVAVSYGGFAAFVCAALVRGWPLASCGCFGRPDSKPTYSHALLDVGAVVAAALWAASGPASTGHLFLQAPLVVVVVVITGLAYLVWTSS